ncbi:unnamed protein product [Durusdinium trenchii]|uniref:Phosphatidic acid phosphatase type 2/haloperoxidase domain-containing protein n=1 Tax=Durusdinium trenchii TaxID=1381693 RepID=A0ABP0LVM2_9DINO
MYAFEGRLLFSRDTLLVFIFFCACLLPELHIWKPYQREIPMQRLTLSNGTTVFVENQVFDNKYIPSNEQIVPTAFLLALCIVIPGGALALVLWFDVRPKSGEVASFLRGILMAVGCMFANVDAVKLYVGYFRPYFYEECGLDRSTGECLTPTEDGRKSFPSGHASTSFCAMLFTSLYLLGKVARLPSKTMTSFLGPLGCTNVLLLLALSPVMVAFWVAASRVRENDHHPADVVTGACIGSAWAVLWYVRYFTRLWDDHDDHQSTDGSSRTTESQRAGDEDLPMTA